MLKQGTFINKKFYSMLAFNLLSWGAMLINGVVDAILGGYQLGETALMAVSIVTPLASLISFFAYIFTPGCGILYGMCIGKFDQKAANNVAGTSAISSLILGIAGALILYAIKMPFLRYYGCTGELLVEASSYYNWYIMMALFMPIQNAVYYLVISEGGAFFLMLSSVGSIACNMILSYTLCLSMGVSGLGIATFLCILTGTIINSCHFLTKKSVVHFALSLDINILKKSLLYSANTALNFVFIAVVDIIMNKVILVTCGQIYIAAYAIINFILNLFLMSGGVFDSCQGICTSYVGEKNNYGVNNILRTSMKAVCVITIVIMVILFVIPEYLCKLYGLTTPEVIDASIRATKILCFSSIPYGIVYFAYNIYVCLNRPKLSIIMSFLYNFFCPLLLSIPLAFIMGFDGVSIGMSASSFLVIALFAWFIRLRYGKEGFPWYLEKTNEETIAYDLYVTNESITEIRDKVKTELDNHGYKIENLELLIEELYTRIYEKNPGKKVCSECALLFGENRVRIIVRDNGVIFNFVDVENKIESLNAYVLNSLLERVEDKQYLITTSFNRNGFVFKKI